MSPRVSIHPTDTNVTRLQTFTLICEGIGNPIPEVLWTHNDSVIDPAKEHVSVLSLIAHQRASNTLTISMADVNTSGLYYCTVTVAGEAVRSRSAFVFVQGEPYYLSLNLCTLYNIIDYPEPPRNVVAIEVTQNTIALMWIKPHNNYAPIIGYYIMYTRAGFQTNVVNTSIESINLTGLISGRVYTINVTAFNEIGASNPSDALIVQTLRDVIGNLYNMQGLREK